jgi:tetratricopeptide (TPR) repeat protein
MAEYPRNRAYRVWLAAIHFDEGQGRPQPYRERGTPQHAVAAFTEALRLEESAVVYLQRARTYIKMNEFDKALADYTEAIRLDPESTTAYNNRAVTYAKKGDFERALADYTEAIRLDPHDATVWREVAAARLAAGKVDAYRSTCSAILDRFAKTEKAEDAFSAAMTFALAPDAVRDWPKAIALAEIAQRRDPKDPDYECALGAILFRAGRFEEAIRHLKEADRLAPPPGDSGGVLMAETWFFLSMAHHRFGHHEEAKKWLDKAVAWTDKILDDEKKGTVAVRWNRRLTLKLLREEAETLLKPSPPPQPSKPAEKGKEKSK